MSDDTQVQTQDSADATPVVPAADAPVTETPSDTPVVDPETSPVLDEPLPVVQEPEDTSMPPENGLTIAVDEATTLVQEIAVVELFQNQPIVTKTEVDLKQFPDLQGYVEIELANGTKTRVPAESVIVRQG